jgi:3-oxoacyl-[acyl-carrier protein] reductase
MTLRLQERRIVVTGGARGLGLACVARFLNEGAKVVIADNDGEAGAAAMASHSGSANVVFARCDVSVREELEAAIQRCVVEWGGIDVLLNNAAIAPQADILSIGDQT